MTRTIKPSEIQPGMTVHWEGRGFIHEGLVERTTAGVYPRATRVLSGQFGMDIPEDAEVTVLTEAQPEEPTEFGAKVIMDGRRFLRVPLHSSDSTPWLSQLDGRWRGWDDLCEMGPVTVIPDQGWTAPETPVVPERVEEWPEDDEHLRACRWVDSDECEWRHVGNGEWRFVTHSGDLSYPHTRPWDGPWTRVSDV